MGWTRNSSSALQKTVPTWSRQRYIVGLYIAVRGRLQRGWRMLASMKVLLFGATGMIGQGVLRECLLDPGVESVVAIGRSPSGQSHPKLRYLVQRDLFDYSAIECEFADLD